MSRSAAPTRVQCQPASDRHFRRRRVAPGESAATGARSAGRVQVRTEASRVGRLQTAARITNGWRSDCSCRARDRRAPSSGLARFEARSGIRDSFPPARPELRTPSIRCLPADVRSCVEAPEHDACRPCSNRHRRVFFCAVRRISPCATRKNGTGGRSSRAAKTGPRGRATDCRGALRVQGRTPGTSQPRARNSFFCDVFCARCARVPDRSANPNASGPPPTPVRGRTPCADAVKIIASGC
jgi:hypothetical protein